MGISHVDQRAQCEGRTVERRPAEGLGSEDQVIGKFSLKCLSFKRLEE